MEETGTVLMIDVAFQFGATTCSEKPCVSNDRCDRTAGIPGSFQASQNDRAPSANARQKMIEANVRDGTA